MTIWSCRGTGRAGELNIKPDKMQSPSGISEWLFNSYKWLDCNQQRSPLFLTTKESECKEVSPWNPPHSLLLCYSPIIATWTNLFQLLYLPLCLLRVEWLAHLLRTGPLAKCDRRLWISLLKATNTLSFPRLPQFPTMIQRSSLPTREWTRWDALSSTLHKSKET